MGRKAIVASGLAASLVAATGVSAAAPATTSAPTPSVGASALAAEGYWLVEQDGSVYSYGLAAPLTLTPGTPPPPAGVAAVDIATNWAGTGAYVLFANGAVAHYGSAGVDPIAPLVLGRGEVPVAVLPSPLGDGGWLVTTWGRVVASGLAPTLGDLSGVSLRAPIVDAAATPAGDGYVMVAADGGVFTFGSVAFVGSLGGVDINEPVVAIAPTLTGRGYHLVAADGGVFAFGDAEFHGSTGSVRLNRPVVAVSPTLEGYRLVGADGGVFNFGDAEFFGSLGATPPDTPVVELASMPNTPVTAAVRFTAAAVQAGFQPADFDFLIEAAEGEEGEDADEGGDGAAPESPASTAAGAILGVATMLALLEQDLSPEMIEAQIAESVTTEEITARDGEVLAWALETASEARSVYGLTIIDLIT